VTIYSAADALTTAGNCSTLLGDELKTSEHQPCMQRSVPLPLISGTSLLACITKSNKLNYGRNLLTGPIIHDAS
jgi:hypothetical protein